MKKIFFLLLVFGFTMECIASSKLSKVSSEFIENDKTEQLVKWDEKRVYQIILNDDRVDKIYTVSKREIAGSKCFDSIIVREKADTDSVQTMDESDVNINKSFRDNSNAIMDSTKSSNYSNSIYKQILIDQANALLEYTKEIELNPQSFLAYYNRGSHYLYMKQNSNAILDFDKAIELNPKDADSYYKRGSIYDDLKEYSNAILDYTKVIELKPNDAEAYCNRGFTYDIGLKDYSKAISDFTKAIELNPKDAEVYQYRGLSYSQSGNNEKACEDWKKAVSLGDKESKELLEKNCK